MERLVTSRTEVAVVAVLLRGNVLMLRRSPQETLPFQWGFVAGHREGNETHHQNAAREAAEETGLPNLGPFVQLGASGGYPYHIHGSRAGHKASKLARFFAVSTDATLDDVELSSEHDKKKVLSYAELDAIRRGGVIDGIGMYNVTPTVVFLLQSDGLYGSLKRFSLSLPGLSPR